MHKMIQFYYTTNILSIDTKPSDICHSSTTTKYGNQQNESTEDDEKKITQKYQTYFLHENQKKTREKKSRLKTE